MQHWLLLPHRQRSPLARAAGVASFLLRDICNGPSHGTEASRASIAWLHYSSHAERNAETASPGNLGEAGVVGSLTACIIAAVDATAVMPSAASSPRDAAEVDDDDHEDEDEGVRVVVVTPYLHQKSLVEREIARALALLTGENLGKALHRVVSAGIVNTADSFQGQVRCIQYSSVLFFLSAHVSAASCVGGGYRSCLHSAISLRRPSGR